MKIITLRALEEYKRKTKEIELLKVYPVGSIYFSINSTNPGTLFGGTWQRIAKGRTLVGIDENDVEFNTANKTGGEKTHKLTVNEMPSHSHKIYGYYNMNPQGGNYVAGGVVSSQPQHYGNYPEPTGGSQSHNNLQPYLTCYIWQRVS